MKIVEKDLSLEWGVGETRGGRRLHLAAFAYGIWVIANIDDEEFIIEYNDAFHGRVVRGLEPTQSLAEAKHRVLKISQQQIADDDEGFLDRLKTLSNRSQAEAALKLWLEAWGKTLPLGSETLTLGSVSHEHFVLVAHYSGAARQVIARVWGDQDVGVFRVLVSEVVGNGNFQYSVETLSLDDLPSTLQPTKPPTRSSWTRVRNGWHLGTEDIDLRIVKDEQSDLARLFFIDEQGVERTLARGPTETLKFNALAHWQEWRRGQANPKKCECEGSKPSIVDERLRNINRDLVVSDLSQLQLQEVEAHIESLLNLARERQDRVGFGHVDAPTFRDVRSLLLIEENPSDVIKKADRDKLQAATLLFEFLKAEVNGARTGSRALSAQKLLAILDSVQTLDVFSPLEILRIQDLLRNDPGLQRKKKKFFIKGKPQLSIDKVVKAHPREMALATKYFEGDSLDTFKEDELSALLRFVSILIADNQSPRNVPFSLGDDEASPGQFSYGQRTFSQLSFAERDKTVAMFEELRDKIWETETTQSTPAEMLDALNRNLQTKGYSNEEVKGLEAHLEQISMPISERILHVAEDPTPADFQTARGHLLRGETTFEGEDAAVLTAAQHLLNYLFAVAESINTSHLWAIGANLVVLVDRAQTVDILSPQELEHLQEYVELHELDTDSERETIDRLFLDGEPVLSVDKVVNEEPRLLKHVYSYLSERSTNFIPNDDIEPLRKFVDRVLEENLSPVGLTDGSDDNNPGPFISGLKTFGELSFLERDAALIVFLELHAELAPESEEPTNVGEMSPGRAAVHQVLHGTDPRELSAIEIREAIDYLQDWVTVLEEHEEYLYSTQDYGYTTFNNVTLANVRALLKRGGEPDDFDKEGSEPAALLDVLNDLLRELQSPEVFDEQDRKRRAAVLAVIRAPDVASLPSEHILWAEEELESLLGLVEDQAELIFDHSDKEAEVMGRLTPESEFADVIEDLEEPSEIKSAYLFIRRKLADVRRALGEDIDEEELDE